MSAKINEIMALLEQKTLELQACEEQFQATFNQAWLGIAHLDLAGKWLRVNQKYCDIVGYPEADLRKLNFQDITHPDDIEADFKIISRLLADEIQNCSLEKRYIRKDYSVVWVKLSVSLVRTADGAAGYFIVVAEDITARKKAEKALVESEQRYRHLYNDTPIMLHSIDRRGRLLSVSNYWLETLGYERDEVIGRKSTDFQTEESKHYAEEVVLPEFFQTGYCKDVPYQFIKKGGERIDVLLSAIAERDNTGEVVRSMAVMIDVTARKQAEEEIEILHTDLSARAAELEAANRELEAFSYTVSHDLRKPLTVINGYCQVIQELCSENLGDQCRGYLQEIHDGTWRMNHLIDALLNFSCLTRSELHRESVDLSAVAREVASELTVTDPERRITFRIADGVTADGDANLLRVVLENLLGNAWKYTGARTEAVIEFGATDVNGRPTCFVRDNGPGFAMEDAEKLFNPFQRLPGTEEFRGHGIGLATVARIINRHGGRVWAEGEPDAGATFYFTLNFS